MNTQEETASYTVPQKTQWAIVELMGHQKLAGRISEAPFGGATFIRIDVPAIHREGLPPIQAYSVLHGPGSIYRITFVDQPTAELAASQIRGQPYTEWELKRALVSLPAGHPADAFNEEDEDVPY